MGFYGIKYRVFTVIRFELNVFLSVTYATIRVSGQSSYLKDSSGIMSRPL